MARPIRVEFPRAVYHVMARGNERREIFRDDADRRRFLETLGEMVERFGVRLHAYCLMPNHYHLVLGTPQPNLSRAMSWLQTTYTVRFNRRHRRSGHLFQGRFKAQLVEADTYARWLVEYVHLNPVRPRQRGVGIPAERAAELAAYAWSSHRAYAGTWKKPPGWLCLDWRRYWGGDVRESQRNYREALARWFGSAPASPWDELQRGLVLGGVELLAKAQQVIAGKGGITEARWTREERSEALREQVCRVVATEAAEVRMWARVRLAGEPMIGVAREFGYRDGSGLTHCLKTLEARAAQEPQLKQKLEAMRHEISSFKR